MAAHKAISISGCRLPALRRTHTHAGLRKLAAAVGIAAVTLLNTSAFVQTARRHRTSRSAQADTC